MCFCSREEILISSYSEFELLAIEEALPAATCAFCLITVLLYAICLLIDLQTIRSFTVE